MMNSLCLSHSLSHIIEVPTGSNKGKSSGIIIGAAVGGSLLLLLLVLVGLYAFRQKKKSRKSY
jgi:hypothetical protein